MAVLRSHNFDTLTVSSNSGNNVIAQKQVLSPDTNIVAVNDFGYLNNTSLKVVLDYSLGKYNGRWRSEARLNSDTTLSEVWHSLCLYIPNDYMMGSDFQETIHQHHGGSYSGASPTIAFRLTETNLLIRHINGSVPNQTQSITTFQTPISKGVWNKITFKAGFFANSNGYLKVWMNRNIVYNYSGPLHFEGAATPPTSHKLGIYDSTRSGDPVGFTSRTLFYDEVRYANTLDDDWNTFIALDADGLPALSGIDPPVVGPFILTLTTTAGGAVIRDPASGTIAQNATVILTATPATGFNFSRWENLLTGQTLSTSATYNHVMLDDISIVAVFLSDAPVDPGDAIRVFRVDEPIV